MKVIGLTGGIGSGKSTVAQFLEELGAVFMDLDKVGHEVLKQKDIKERLVQEFGEGILNEDGDIDRTKLGGIVFNDSQALSRLNNISHPAIDSRVNARIEEYHRQGVKVVVLEAAALLDAGRAPQFDEIWVTAAPESVVLNRLENTQIFQAEDVKARIDSQISDEARAKQADVVIDTDCTLEELKDRRCLPGVAVNHGIDIGRQDPLKIARNPTAGYVRHAANVILLKQRQHQGRVTAVHPHKHVVDSCVQFIYFVTRFQSCNLKRHLARQRIAVGVQAA